MAFAPALLSRNVALAVGPAPPFTVKTEPGEAVLGQNHTTKREDHLRAGSQTFDEEIALAVVPYLAGSPRSPPD